MRTRAILIAAAVLFAAMAFGQAPGEQLLDRTLRFTYTETPQGFLEIQNTIRAITEMRHATADVAAKTLVLGGTSAQIALAEWLFQQLDKPAGTLNPGVEQTMPGINDGVVRVFYLANAPTPQAMQEIVNAIRSVGEVQRVTVCNGPRALTVRATRDQVAIASWIIDALDGPTGAPASPAFHFPDTRAPEARVFYLQHASNPQVTQEIVNTVRSVAEVQRIIVYNQRNAIVMRAAPEQVAAAEWLVHDLDQPAGGPAAHEYTLPATFPWMRENNVLRVFHLASGWTPQRMQETVNRIRSEIQIQRVTVCTMPRALAVRGTANQVALAAQMIQERDKPAAQ